MKTNSYIGNTNQHIHNMNVRLLLFTQTASFILMLGTAEHLFTGIISTIVFVSSFALFVKSSIYINKNEKWLLRNSNADNEE